MENRSHKNLEDESQVFWVISLLHILDTFLYHIYQNIRTYFFLPGKSMILLEKDYIQIKSKSHENNCRKSGDRKNNENESIKQK